ncbi:MAG: sugar nucleotide-binding protein [Lachnospiraceae bacterium]|nr:sugar nucleotide-binding protein [Lachnospiraceae bacterium]
MQYLIIGANSSIGSYLYKRMKEEGLDVVGTGHVRNINDELIYYDILKDDIDSVLQGRMDKPVLAIICIAMAQIDQCLLERESAYQINVVKTKELIRYFTAQNIKVIYFSSEYVFDGVKGSYTEQDSTNPINQYGYMKEEMEKHIVEYEPTVCVFRISKVVHTERIDQNVLWQWEQLQKKHEIIRCIKGNKMSFVSIEDIYQASCIVKNMDLCGIYNISGDVSYSRKELAEKFFEMAGADEYKIEECEATEFGFKERRPMDVSLDNRKFKERTGYKFTPMDAVIESYVQNNI